jgi:hypothetical protein
MNRTLRDADGVATLVGIDPTRQGRERKISEAGPRLVQARDIYNRLGHADARLAEEMIRQLVFRQLGL